jgi:hypothetical protein
MLADQRTLEQQQAAQDLQGSLIDATTERYAAEKSYEAAEKARLAALAMAEDDADAAQLAAISGAAGAGAGAAASDIRAKTAIGPPSRGEERALLDDVSNEDLIRMLQQSQDQERAVSNMTAQPQRGGVSGLQMGGSPESEELLGALEGRSSYRYRPEAKRALGEPSGDQYGPMAQDLERTEIGKSLVKQGPGGVKMVDTGRAAMVGLGLHGAQKERQDELEARLNRLENPTLVRDTDWLDDPAYSRGSMRNEARSAGGGVAGHGSRIY